MYPSDRKYTKDHEWLRVEAGVATVGITDFAQRELGDIVYVEVPEPGRKFQAGDVMGTIESVKAVSEIFAPAGGVVVESNAALRERPQAVNEDPHGTGWYCRLQLSDAREVEGLLDAGDYLKLAG
jgi:glycine cleavage system H protein